MENEIIAAEIYLHPVQVEAATAEIDNELKKVEEEIRANTVNASLLDYSIAVGSGLVAGAVDAFYVKEDPLLQNLVSMDGEKLLDTVKKIFLQKPVPGHSISAVKSQRAVDVGFPSLVPVLETVAAQRTPLGLAAAVLVQFERGGMLWKKDKKLKIFPEGISGADALILVVAALFVGIMKWLNTISAEPGEPGEKDRLKVLDRLCQLIRRAKAFPQMVKEIEKWQRQLPNEIKARNGRKNEKAGVEETFYSFFVMLAGVPAFRNSNMRKTLQAIEDRKRLLSDEKPILQSLNRQGFPVLINEMIVRSLFFACRLIRELMEKEIDQIDWERIVPFGNRDIDRLIALSAMTLSVADTADAAIRAAIDSSGDAVLFATRFVTRFNYVAAGRAAVAVVREISNEQRQSELIHIRRLLMEARTAKAVEILEAYQQQLETRVSEYLAEDIKAFLEGLL